MKIEHIQRNWRTGDAGRSTTDLETLLQHYAKKKRDEYDRSGQIERLKEDVEYNAEFVFKLVALLVDRGVLSPLEVLDRVVDRWNVDGERIIVDGETLKQYRQRTQKEAED